MSIYAYILNTAYSNSMKYVPSKKIPIRYDNRMGKVSYM